MEPAGDGMSAGESFADWLSVIVVSDDPANGGAGLLTLTDCAKCDGMGIVEHSHRSGMRLVPCPVCSGEGEPASAANTDANANETETQ